MVGGTKVRTYTNKESYHYACCDIKVDSDNENIIDISFIARNTRRQKIAVAKVGKISPAESIAIVREINNMIHAMYLYRKLPLVVDFATALPGKPSDMKGIPIQFLRDKSSFNVVINCNTIASYDFTSEGQGARNTTDHYIRDWDLMAHNLGMDVIHGEKDYTKDEIEYEEVWTLAALL